MHSHLPTAITSLLFLLPLASAGCYNDKPPNTDVQFGLDNTHEAAQYLQGNLVGKQIRGLCVSDTAVGNSWYFSIENTGKTGQDVTKEDIENYLRQEVNGCQASGGRSKHEKGIAYKYVSIPYQSTSLITVSTYSADPNSGVCMDINWINNHPLQRRAVGVRASKVVMFPVNVHSRVRPQTGSE